MTCQDDRIHQFTMTESKSFQKIKKKKNKKQNKTKQIKTKFTTKQKSNKKKNLTLTFEIAEYFFRELGRGKGYFLR